MRSSMRSHAGLRILEARGVKRTMDDLSGIRQQLATLLDNAAKRQADEQSTRAKDMQEFETRRSRFEQLAGTWASDLVVPRLQALAESLPQAGEVERFHGGCCARLTFAWSKELPVSASLTVSIVPGGPNERACVQIEPRLIPMLVGHPPVASREFDLEPLDTQSLTEFLDQEILTFAEHYLRIREPASPYQQQVLVKDPVCGMTIRQSDAVETHTHGGKQYYFCAPLCAERFRQDPESYLRWSSLA